MCRYEATVKVVFKIQFEHDGSRNLDLEDQAKMVIPDFITHESEDVEVSELRPLDRNRYR